MTDSMQEHTIKIERLVSGGKGLGRLPDGKAVFVPFVLPDEVVRIRIREEKKRHAFGDLIAVETASSLRIAPRCAHFGQCGGCHYQHMAYADQVRFKRQIFEEQLQRIGGLDELPPISMIEAQNPWQYRNTIQFHTTKAGDLAYMDAAYARPFAVKECWLPMEDIGAMWPQVSLAENMDLQRVEMRQNPSGDLMLVMESSSGDIPEMEITIPLSIVHQNKTDTVVLSGEPYLMQTVASQDFKVSAGSFFQTNFDGAAVLVETVTRMVKGMRGTLLDLYCGVGLFTRFLADQFDQVIGVEVSESACDDFLENLNAFDHISLFQGAVEHVLPDLDVEVDCAVVDPPRKGLDRFALDALAETQVPMIVYVSCDPSTLARDIKRLGKSGYALQESVVVDMFPQTYHIESVNLLRMG